MQLNMKTDVVVHGTRVFLEKKADETTTAGGIILSEISAKTFALYTVVASGVDKHSRGDQVVCQSMGPQALPEELFGERMFYVEAEDIVATIRPSLKELCEPLETTPVVFDGSPADIPDMDPNCPAITDGPEGGTELKCPEKGGA